MTTGQATDLRGRNIMPVSSVEAGAKAVGFNPSRIASASEMKQGLTEAEGIMNYVRGGIVDDLTRAALANKPEDMQAARQSWSEWNRDHPDLPIIIHPGEVAQRVRQARMQQDMRFAKSLPKVLRREAIEELHQ